jgi:hypothetical protein
VVIAIGGLLTAAYVFTVLASAMATPEAPVTLAPVSRSREAIVLALAVLSAVLGVAALAPLDLVLTGRDFAAGGAR